MTVKELIVALLDSPLENEVYVYVDQDDTNTGYVVEVANRSPVSTVLHCKPT